MTLAAVVLLSCLSSPSAFARDPDKGCAWKTIISTEAGVEFRAQKCDLGFRTIDFIQKGSSFYEVMHDTDGAHPDGVWPIITVYSKGAEETPQDAIHRLIFPSFDAYRKEHCVVKPEMLPFPRGTRTAYSIFPDQAYKVKIDSETPQDDVPEPPCGDFGFLPDNFGYFEFHPAENPRRFIYVLFGQESAPLFDEESFKFLP